MSFESNDSMNLKPLKASQSNAATKQQFLSHGTIGHIDITTNAAIVPVVEAMMRMAFSARDLGRAADIYNRMLADKECGIILTLAGSLISAGLKKVIVDMVRNNMVDAIVSTGANIVDQDFFEGLGFKHYIADEALKSGLHDGSLREHALDRIYDTLIDEEELRVCDETTQKIFDDMEPGAHSSREFTRALGQHLNDNGAKTDDCILLEAFKRDVPIFCPAFNDCSAGFGLVAHAVPPQLRPGSHRHLGRWEGLL